MKKFIILILISMSLSEAMEENPQEFRNNHYENSIISHFKEHAEFDRSFQEELFTEEAIQQSIESETQRQLLKIAIANLTVTWQMLPEEIILHIFSYIPYSMKHIALINKQSKALTSDYFFLQALANYLVKKNLKKGVEIFGHAIETESKILTTAFLKANIIETITNNARLENSSIEDFHQAIIKMYPTIAAKVFVKAVQKNNISLVQAFINAGIDINNAHNSRNNNALMEAAYHNHLEIARLLINNNAHINIQNTNGYSPLYLAAVNGHIDMVQLLLDHPITNIDIQTNEYNTTPLIIAARLGHKTIVELLIDHHANINAKECTKHTALMYASFNGHVEIVKLLLEKGADARIQTRKPKNWYIFSKKMEGQFKDKCYGYTALMFACEEGYENIVEDLLIFSDIDAKNDHGFTALQCVSNTYLSNPNLEGDAFKKIIDLLIRNGALLPSKQTICFLS